MTRPHYHSENLLGLDWRQLQTRPIDIPTPTDTGFLSLTSLATERMSLARHRLDQIRSPAPLKRRLCSWWDDLSHIIVRHGYIALVRSRLRDGETAEVSAAISWFAGTWHPDNRAMSRILWRISCSVVLVSAAVDLHIRALNAAEETPMPRKSTA